MAQYDETMSEIKTVTELLVAWLMGPVSESGVLCGCLPTVALMTAGVRESIFRPAGIWIRFVGSNESWERNGSMRFVIKRDRQRAEIFVAPGGVWGTN